MSLREIHVPHHVTYNFGVGVDRLSGTAMNRVVNPIPVPPLDAGGAIQSFDISRVSSTEDMQQKLGIDINASYGCASFGAGASARFSFAQDSQVHAESLFLAITSTLRFADLSISDCVLTSNAAQVIDRPDIFTARYGDMFARACQRGGIFVGLMRIETFDEHVATQIEGELKGSYGLFSADMAAKFSTVTSKHNANVYCSVYAEGGPVIQIHNPNEPGELLNLANTWISEMFRDPNQYARPYQWTLAPTSIAEGPLPLNSADIEHAQDVLKFCARERSTLLDQVNQLTWWLRHQENYDWTGSATPEQITTTVRAMQIDLDTVAACASAAINSPIHALMPADYATAQVPLRQYPSSQPLIGPKPLPGVPSVIPEPAGSKETTDWTKWKVAAKLDPKVLRVNPELLRFKDQ